MRKQGGFTIIEVTLFLAISAALLLLVFGLQMMVSRQRFQDAMVTLRTTVQSEYEEVRTGIDSRLGGDMNRIESCDTSSGGSAAGASPNCMMIGKLLRFNTNSSDIDINYVVATGVIPDKDDNLTDEDALRSTTNFSLIAVDSQAATKANDPAVQQQTIKMQAGAEFTQGWTIPDTGVDTQGVSGIAILRSPISGAVLVFAMKDGVVLNEGQLNMSETSAIYNTPMAFIIKNAYSGLAGGAVCVDRGQTSSAVRLAMPAEPDATWTADSLRSLCSQ